MRKAFAAIFKRTETSLAAVIVIVSLFFSFSSPYFLTLSNASDLIEAYSVTTILAAGVFVVLVSGGIDISFASVASVTQYIAAMAATNYGIPALPAIALACALGALLGCINALLTYYLNVVSIIVTIATSSIFYALLIYFTGDRSLELTGEDAGEFISRYELHVEGRLPPDEERRAKQRNLRRR